MKEEDYYKQQLALILQANEKNIFLYWKGRVAFYALLKAMNIQEGDEIILPAFTCVVVANAIKYLKAKPVYVDIYQDSYTMNIEEMKKKITPRTKVAICQNTFGLSANIDEFLEVAKSHNLYTIEDCTHGFGGYYNEKPNGSYCDAAFYSTQWNKPFSTGIGGFALLNRDDLFSKLQEINKELIPANIINGMSLSILYFAREHILNNRFYWSMLRLYRLLSKFNILQGSSSGVELEGIEMPKHYFKAISKTQIKKGIQNLKTFQPALDLWKKNAILYTDYLKEKGKSHVPDTLFENHTFLLYPILVKERKEVHELAEKYHIPVGDWFCSPLHPVEDHLERWDLDTTQFPVAVDIASKIINLPTKVKDIKPILSFLDKIEDHLL